MNVLTRHLKKLRANNDGATAVEAAIVFPIIVMCLFGVFGIGTYMYGTHQAQRTVEETARKARVINSPSKADLVTLLNDNMKGALLGTYQPNVTVLSQFDGNYAELSITYSLNFEFPFIDLERLTTKSTTQVKLRSLPI